MIEWFNSLLGEALGTYAAIGVGLLIVVVLIIVLLRLVRAFGGGIFGKQGHNRLGVVEAAAVDNKRRLVLIRRDNVEHLVMIGGTTDVLVEAGISRTGQAARPDTAMSQTAPTAPQMASQQKPAAPQTAPSQAPKTPQAPQTPQASQTPQAAKPVQPAQPPASMTPPAVQATSAPNNGSVRSPQVAPVATPSQPAATPQHAVKTPQAVNTAAPTPAPKASVAPGAATTTPKPSAPVVTPQSDSAKVGDEMDRLLNQIAGEPRK